MIKKIVLFIFIPLIAFANVKILPRYCINSNFVMLYDISDDPKDKELLFDLNDTYVKSEFIKSELTKRGIKYKDFSGGIAEFKTDCTFMDFVKTEFLKEIYEKYESLKINNFDIFPQTKLPNDIFLYNINDIKITDIRNKNGTFRLFLSRKDNLNTKKTLFFRYILDAKIGVFIAKNDINAKHVLNLNDYKYEYVDLKSYKINALSEIPEKKIVSKQKIKKDSILTSAQFGIMADVKKNSTINAIFKDNSLSLNVEVKALDGGVIGDIIRVRTNDNKLFNAKIISKNGVLIQWKLLFV